MFSVSIYDRALVKELLAAKRYRDAVEYLSSVKHQREHLALEEMADLYLSLAQCYYWLGEFRKAAIKAKTSIKLSESLNDNLLYARQKYTLGQIYQETGRLDLALQEYTEAHAFFKRVNDKRRMLTALERVALVHDAKGNYRQAQEVNESVLRQARSLHLPEHIRIATFNLSRVLLSTGDFKRTAELLDSIPVAEIDPLHDTWHRCLAGMLQVFLLDSAAAKKHLSASLKLARENGYRRDEVVCLEYFGLNEYFQGNYRAARGFFEEILALREITASATSQTLRMLTDVYIAEDDWSTAEATAAKAEVAITRIGERIELGALYRAYGQIYDHNGDHDQARAHFADSLELLRQLGARYELALTHRECGKSSCYSREARLDHLHQAKTLFTEMEVSLRVAEVERMTVDAGFSSRFKANALRPEGSRRKKTSVPWMGHYDSHAVTFLNEKGEEKVIITQSAAMREVVELADAFKDTDLAVLITGETGTGKDLLAGYIHYRSQRARGPFVNRNIAALSPSLIESELFGHRKGAFTGAIEEKMGLIESANGGTCCLNEIGELSVEMQAKLLQVLEQRTIQRVGDHIDRPIDVRFVSLTNRNIDEMMKKDYFRHDLFYRLGQVLIHIPSLCERKDEIEPLLTWSLRKNGFVICSAGLTRLSPIVDYMKAYHWPGNVRELRTLVDLAVTLAPERNIEGLLTAFEFLKKKGAGFHVSEKELLLSALRRNHDNQTLAAKELGKPLSTFRNQLKKHGIM